MKHLKNIIQDLHRYLDAIFGFMFKFHYMFYKCISRQITLLCYGSYMYL